MLQIALSVCLQVLAKTNASSASKAISRIPTFNVLCTQLLQQPSHAMEFITVSTVLPITHAGFASKDGEKVIT